MFRNATISTAAVALVSQASACVSILFALSQFSRRCARLCARRSSYLRNWGDAVERMPVPLGAIAQIGSGASQSRSMLSMQTELVASLSCNNRWSMSR